MKRKNNAIDKFMMDLDKHLTKAYSPFAKLAIGVILFMIFFISCTQIIERRSFHEQVKEIAKEEVKRGCCKTLRGDSTNSAIDSIREKNKKASVESDNRIMISNVNANNFSQDGNCLCGDSPIDILAKSDALLNANGLTFCVTLIVSLLATLVVIKIETNERLIRETIKKEINSRYESISRFNHILVRIESLYNLAMHIGNSLTQNEANEVLLNRIGHYITRMSTFCNDLNMRLNSRESRLDYLTIDEKEILETYLEDAFGELKRNKSLINNPDLQVLIDKNLHDIEEIKILIDSIETPENGTC